MSPACWCHQASRQRLRPRCSVWRLIRRCVRGMGAAGRERALERYDEAKVLARTLDLLGL